MTIIDQLEFDLQQTGEPETGVAQAALNAERPWWNTAMNWLRAYAVSGIEFDAYDLTKAGVPEPDHPNRWGALFHTAKTQGLIEHAGYHQSERPGRAGGVCAVWRGKAAT